MAAGSWHGQRSRETTWECRESTQRTHFFAESGIANQAEKDEESEDPSESPKHNFVKVPLDVIVT